MKKLSAALAIIMLLALLPLPAAATGADIGSVRVRLTTNNATSIAMSVSGEYFVSQNGARFKDGSLSLISNADGTLTLTHSLLGELYKGRSFSIMRMTMAPAAGHLYFNSRRYLGHFNITRTSGGYIQIVNEVPLNQYLYGVVGHEMNNNFPMDALKAQAIAAKGYVLTRLLESPSAAYHIGDTSSDQVYKGYTASNTNVIAAVDSTVNEVLTVSGDVLCTYYSACNGGETTLVTYAWPTRKATDAGYAISIDPYDLANPYSIVEVVRIPVSSSGSISQALYDLLIAKTAAVIGTTPTGITRISSVDMNTPRYKGLTRDLTKVSIVLDATVGDSRYENVSLTFNASDLYNYGVVKNSSLRVYWGEYIGDGSFYYIYHARWGHGVGLSQRGAQQRGEQGQSYRDILSFYYPGATLSTVQIPVMSDPTPPADTHDDTPIGDGVTTARVNLRSGPGVQYQSYGMVNRGTELTVYAEESGWYKVTTSGGTAGYIKGDYVAFTPAAPPPAAPTLAPTPTQSGEPPAAPTLAPMPTPTPTQTVDPMPPIAYGIVSAGTVNIRVGPGTTYGILRSLSKDTPVTVYGSSGKWYYVFADGIYGYISSAYIRVTATPTPGETPVAPSETPVAPGETPVAPGETPVAPEPAVEAESAIVTANLVNFREGPGVGYPSLFKLDKNAGLYIISRTGKWCYALYGKVYGYIHSDYVRITGSVTLEDDGGDEASEGRGVTTGSVNFRKGPSVQSEKLRVLSKGTELTLYSLENGWYKAALADGTEGYVSAKYVSVTVPLPAAAPQVEEPVAPGEDESITPEILGVGVATATVNFREGPSTSSKKLSTLKKGTTVTLIALAGGWYEAEYNGVRGYLYAKYVQLTGAPVTPAPTADPPEGGVTPEGDSTGGKGLVLAGGAATAKVNFRISPAVTSGGIIETLKSGASFSVIGETGEWYYILYDGKTGYVNKAHARVTSSGTAGIPTVGTTLTLISTSTTAEVNMREGRGTTSAVIKLLPKGTGLMVYLRLEGWCLVCAGGVYGYVVEDYIKLT